MVQGDTINRLGLPGNGPDVLKLDLIGENGATLPGYDNSTNKLGMAHTISY
jgi:hypothetical protein